MASMSYCMWENATYELHQLLNDLEDAIDCDNPSIKEFLHSKNEYERPCVATVIQQCKDLIEAYEQLEQYDEE